MKTAPISIDMASIDPAINPPVWQQVSHSKSESYPEVDLCQGKNIILIETGN